MAETQAIRAAANRWWEQRSARPCTSVDHCDRTTVLIDGRPANDGLLAQAAQALFVRERGASATAADFTKLMADEGSALFRRALTATAYNGLLLLDAGSVLTDEQRRKVEQSVRGAEAGLADGSVQADSAGSLRPLSAADREGYTRTIRQSAEAHVLAADIAASSNPTRRVAAFMAAALAHHRVEFTGGVGLHESDVLAFATTEAARP